MSWKFVPNDNFSLDQLLEWQKFFFDDLQRAYQDYSKARIFQRYNLPNWRSEEIRRGLAVEESTDNYLKIQEAIKLAKERGL